MCKHAEREHGLHDILEIMLESMMAAEHTEFLHGMRDGNKGNGYRIQSMIYTTNWIERLQKDFRRVTKMRGAMPNDESVLTLMGKTAMDKNSYGRQLPRIDYDKTLFPD